MVNGKGVVAAIGFVSACKWWHHLADTPLGQRPRIHQRPRRFHRWPANGQWGTAKGFPHVQEIERMIGKVRIKPHHRSAIGKLLALARFQIRQRNSSMVKHLHIADVQASNALLCL